jgi:hypothetical protein
MNAETALEFVDDLVFEKTGAYLEDLPRQIFRKAWQDESSSFWW